jgi:UDP-N-acetylmuramyl pentapeptide phosphotransferase/UDP-N-acetylglucosamine-1-phosphate transferase
MGNAIDSGYYKRAPGASGIRHSDAFAISFKATMNTFPHHFAMSLVVCFSAALLGCALILFLLLRTGLAMRLATDVPNQRSLHVIPTPRAGGWGLVPVSVVLILLASPGLSMVAAGVVVLAVVSQVDDRRGLSARVRFLTHFVVAASFLMLFPLAGGAWWRVILMTFGLVWLINLYNFMDGVDGLAGGMTVVGFLAYALAATADQALAYAAISVAGAAAGFLIFNFHPARIFLGDAGSISLGFLAGAMGYWGWRDGIWACWFPLLVFAPFIADASVTLLRRVARGEKFWQAHREHYYQKMVQMGVGHARTALLWYAVMVPGALLALSVRHQAPAMQLSVSVFWLIILFIFGWRIDRLWSQFNQVKAGR